MENKKIKILILCILILTLLLCFGYVTHKNKKNQYISTQEKRIDLYFKYNLNHYKSMKITKFQKSPVDAYFIKGYINNDKQYKFQAYINTGDEGNQFNSSIGYKEEKIGRLLKEKDAKDRLTVDEIIEKEHLDKSEYEAEPPLFFFSGPIE
ncbi:DUF1433 domain-containing protein [Staphylococcus aureus]|uniref:DUF1433 domain-containing protein n=1 Tax=Staphylococcus aureus TaxID=1280 RepID=UPI0013A6C4A5|nr:DUF1433 domain-containing protein [Staphylococcus aureus]NDQ48525.1 DUF1433 domain-containing protein [Staphylococcus aureus]NDQ72097.1 DUF1433 domain-containing protein [Staphylococcus aureus]NDR40935.1 DUF1433 domain-containing protein [Staphylococcus aureus]HDG6048662.1 DUF1433 domain-containing protein [Staphylococcus aureus]HDG6070227.1 DUF1433 domain-containing protein [Staphylococcus aureus]